MGTLLPDVAGAADFGEASLRVLAYLHEELPLALWSITRVEGPRQTHLVLREDNGFGVRLGQVSSWPASFCVRMVSGAAPPVSLDVQADPVYAAAPVNSVARFGSYAGAVVREPGGTLFGGICGLDPETRTDDSALAGAGDVLVLLGQLLSMSLALERAHLASRRDLVAARRAADTDALTGLVNRGAWDRVLQDEAVLLRRLGDPAVVVVLDLDGLKDINDSRGHAAGDEYLRGAAGALRSGVDDLDVVARLGGDEFGVLLRGCSEEAGHAAVARLHAGLGDVGVDASIGWAPVTVLGGVPAAFAAADARMYEVKRVARAARAARGARAGRAGTPGSAPGSRLGSAR